MSTHTHDSIRAVQWTGTQLSLLDQRLLPHESVYLEMDTATAAADAIRDMVVRGAPAIGVAAAYAVVLAARRAWAADQRGWRAGMATDLKALADSRPTAVNLFWALARMGQVMEGLPDDQDPEPALLAAAERIHQEDVDGNRHMGDLGAALLQDGRDVLTHCNTGSLATGGYGTALGVIRSAYAQGRVKHVYADETRPWLQGSRLTAWELVQDGIPVSLLCEGAAASLMREGRVGWVIVGSDRIAANGDAANKIGTYGLAVLARHHGVKFMVAAPTTTIDMEAATGADIPIEQRGQEEVLELAGRRVAAPGANAWNPAFDVTPAALIDAIVTERGVVENPDLQKMKALFEAD
ncbi:S-methyl-5-thioribose-1-phosphate isomerase [Ectothiorhodospira sp. BSL-9]|uniref:S-methyl-5-thioribose-1-phosphate isomerase n=1 Tax=Ectothiorhodospira sp. BSL-9 TaxID=1442136 RepID=UPI0007B43D96|nr:S-methyl-5-thioribose-1-phosphate isomerase [Ectothiorhodospira sp. BSL-9]ANB03333.1 methylthioribose-1-phosphate isomerase [Ectothiorhodospira sp. BSL-9]TVQ70030.1 MAG: S-methyl-5-thioribose-1-phosphate isomerase [Chromatiaceae bacterium]